MWYHFATNTWRSSLKKTILLVRETIFKLGFNLEFEGKVSLGGCRDPVLFLESKP